MYVDIFFTLVLIKTFEIFFRFILGEDRPLYELGQHLIPNILAAIPEVTVTNYHQPELRKRTMSNFDVFTVSNRTKSEFLVLVF